MLEALARSAQPILDSPYIRRVRRNHGLEHATVHMLAQSVPNLSIAGRSDVDGFWLMGDVSTEQVQRAAEEALRRMRNGERRLAIHPNCGTSLLTTGVLVGLAALTGSVGVRRGALQYLGRLPGVIVLSIAAIIFSRPLGLQLQEYFTTLGDPGDLQILSITRLEGRGPRGGKIVFHRVQTRSS
ncbi:MAG: DUF6391 domain-containing protein [Aggregatilineales bacterium]